MNRFPTSIFVKQNNINQQLPKIAEELREVYAEFMGGPVNHHNVAVELYDVIQAAETALEILKEQNGVDTAQAEQDMLLKNSERGYYSN